MKVIHVPVKAKVNVKLPKDLISRLPKKIMLFTTVQFIDQLENMKKQLKGKNVMIRKTKHTRYEGQLLGCNVQKFSGDYDAFLYVGDGLFHPKALVMNNEKPVYVYDPFSKKISIITKKDVEDTIKRRKAALSRFIMAKNIGVLVTTKPGQSFLRAALKLKEKYPEKNFYYLIDNTFNLESLENFPFIEVFVNTACPRIVLDDYERIKKPMVNIGEITDYKEGL